MFSSVSWYQAERQGNRLGFDFDLWFPVQSKYDHPFINSNALLGSSLYLVEKIYYSAVMTYWSLARHKTGCGCVGLYSNSMIGNYAKYFRQVLSHKSYEDIPIGQDQHQGKHVDTRNATNSVIHLASCHQLTIYLMRKSQYCTLSILPASASGPTSHCVIEVDNIWRISWREKDNFWILVIPGNVKENVPCLGLTSGWIMTCRLHL